MKTQHSNSIASVKPFHVPVDRRRFFKSMALVSAGFTLPGYLAEALTLTPQLTQGPFYPLARNIPLDKDNDLVQLNDNTKPASGIVTYVSGRVLDRDGKPMSGALVELWHADNGGEYIFSDLGARNPASDPNFAGFGQFLTASDGRYKFRTVKAGLYQGRTRHLHFGITAPGQKSRYTTQLFWNEIPRDANGHTWETTNDNDMVLAGITVPEQRASVIREFKPVAGSVIGEMETTWDIMMGVIPIEPSFPNTPGGSLVVVGVPVAAASGGQQRFKITIPGYAGYSYEVYSNPTMGNLGWAALPFSMSETGKVDRNIQTVGADGAMSVFVDCPSAKGFYYVAFRLPGANTGTPGANTGTPGANTGTPGANTGTPGESSGGPGGPDSPGGAPGGRRGGPGGFGPPPGRGGDFPPHRRPNQ